MASFSLPDRVRLDATCKQAAQLVRAKRDEETVDLRWFDDPVSGALFDRASLQLCYPARY